MKRVLFVATMLLIFASVSISAKAETYSIKDSLDGGYEVGIEYFKPLKKIEKPPNDINPKLTSAEVLEVFESSRKGEKYLHKGASPRKTILLSIIPYKAEKLNEKYELSILENGKWEWKLLQSMETINLQIFYVFMGFVFLGIACLSISERLWLRSVKRLLFFYLVILVIGYLMLSNPISNTLASVISIIGFIIAVLMLIPDEANFLFPIGMVCCLFGGILIFLIVAFTQKPDPHLLLRQWMAFIAASAFAAFFIGELFYQIKKKVDKANAVLTEIPGHEDS